MTVSKGLPARRNYIATIDSVREITLSGYASVEFWSDYLRPSGLSPLEFSGKARVHFTAVHARWMTLPFLETTIVLDVAPTQSPEQPAAFLVAATNTSRCLAFLERSLFRTPYQLGKTSLSLEPLRFTARYHDGSVFDAKIGHRSAERREESDWEGVVFLPSRNVRDQLVMQVRLAGLVEVYPFAADGDIWNSSGDGAVSQWSNVLQESRFEPHEWRIRRSAVHARSRTFHV